ncbi:hypothetical protein [Actinoplanes sp. NPDC026619]|uniref:hypothetical protein n=1 Tax=Actinoplanes sp. NPDC026619 TaxID=3155798 RepID=UPI003406CC1E
MPEVAEVVRRGEFSRIQLGTAFQDAIGRDPFRQEKTLVSRDRSSWSWWKNLGAVIIGQWSLPSGMVDPGLTSTLSAA